MNLPGSFVQSNLARVMIMPSAEPGNIGKITISENPSSDDEKVSCRTHAMHGSCMVIDMITKSLSGSSSEQNGRHSGRRHIEMHFLE